jgi:hypothetical protein
MSFDLRSKLSRSQTQVRRVVSGHSLGAAATARDDGIRGLISGSLSPQTLGSWLAGRRQRWFPADRRAGQVRHFPQTCAY